MTTPPHPDGSAPSTNPGGPVIGGFAYWRKNPLLASSMVPMMMTLVNGSFRATDQHGALVFEAPAAEVSGKLGAMGTLKLTVRGDKFALVGRGSAGGTEAGVSQGQIQQLHAFYEQFPQAAAVHSGTAGPIVAAVNGAAGATMQVWRDGLAAAGARMR